MQIRIANHIRSNIVGYIALFLFAIGGSAYALDGLTFRCGPAGNGCP